MRCKLSVVKNVEIYRGGNYVYNEQPPRRKTVQSKFLSWTLFLRRLSNYGRVWCAQTLQKFFLMLWCQDVECFTRKYAYELGIKLTCCTSVLYFIYFIFLWSSGKGQARIGKGWQSRWKASKLKPLPRAYIKVGCHHHPPPPPPPTQKSHYTQLMARWWLGEAGGGKGRCVGSLWVTLGSL